VNIDLRAGKLYRYGGELMLWKTHHIAPAEEAGITVPYEPILILELLQERFGDRWAHVLAGGMAGWLKVHYLNLDPIDQEAP